jgi:hypothetical protein
VVLNSNKLQGRRNDMSIRFSLIQSNCSGLYRGPTPQRLRENKSVRGQNIYRMEHKPVSIEAVVAEADSAEGANRPSRE